MMILTSADDEDLEIQLNWKGPCINPARVRWEFEGDDVYIGFWNDGSQYQRMKVSLNDARVIPNNAKLKAPSIFPKID